MQKAKLIIRTGFEVRVYLMLCVVDIAWKLFLLVIPIFFKAHRAHGKIRSSVISVFPLFVMGHVMKICYLLNTLIE